MSFKIKLTVILLTLVVTNNSYSQLKSNHIPHVFDNAIEEIKVPEKYSDFGIVILKDNITYGYHSFIRYTRYKIQNDSAYKELGDFYLPQILDPLLAQYNSTRYVKNRASHIYDLEHSLKEFGIRVIRANGEKIEINDEAKVKLLKIKFREQHYRFTNTQFELPKLYKGDELEIYYKVEPETPSFGKSKNKQRYNFDRIFLNEIYPKVQFEIKIISYTKHNIAFSVNNIKKYNYTIDTSSTNDKKETIIRINELDAIGNLWNSKFYEDVANIKFNGLKNIYKEDSSGSLVVSKKFSWNDELMKHTYLKFEEHLDEFNTVDNLTYTSIFENAIKTAPDTSYLSIVNHFHNSINNEYEFNPDLDVEPGTDISLLNIGRNLKNKVLRASVSGLLYIRILDKFNVMFYKTVMIDNRIDDLKFDVFNPMYNIPDIYCIKYNNQYYFMSAKSHRFGHYMNEFPFYYEDNNVIAFDSYIPVPKGENFFKAQRKPNAYYLKTPASTSDDNQRISNVLVELNLTDKSVRFNNKLKLSGQFSTLIRGYYTYKYVDSTINPKYYKDFYKLSANSKLEKKIKVNESETFPFSTNFNFIYSDPTLLSMTSDSVYSLPMKNLFNYVIDNDLSLNTYNNYNFDFKQSDTYRYLLKFDSKIQLLETPEQVNLVSSFGSFTFSVRQISDDSIMLESNLLIQDNRVSKDNLMEIQKLITNLKVLEEAKLNFKKI